MALYGFNTQDESMIVLDVEYEEYKKNIKSTIQELATWIKSESEFIEVPDNEIVRDISKN